jgi:hypothetical protein
MPCQEGRDGANKCSCGSHRQAGAPRLMPSDTPGEETEIVDVGMIPLGASHLIDGGTQRNVGQAGDVGRSRCQQQTSIGTT